jgi:predicted DNA-binding transcriptional regulator AlpA
MNLEGYVSTERAADLLGIKVASVYLYVRRLEGFPQPVKVGRTLLFCEADLIAWRVEHPSRKIKGGDSSAT